MGCGASTEAPKTSAPAQAKPAQTPRETEVPPSEVLPKKEQITKMEEELLWYMNEGQNKAMRLTCWDYGGQVRVIASLTFISLHFTFSRHHLQRTTKGFH